MNWDIYEARWKACQLCDLHKTADNIVLYRGTKPTTDVLFIGESPGPTEDLCGYPFAGPSGKLLDRLIEETRSKIASILRVNHGVTGPHPAINFKCGFTNLISCIPIKDPHKLIITGPATTHVAREGNFRLPIVEEIQACSTRLQELITLTQPRIIVYFGRSDFTPIPNQVEAILSNIKYPSYWRKTGATKGIHYRIAASAFLSLIQTTFIKEPPHAETIH